MRPTDNDRGSDIHAQLYADFTCPLSYRLLQTLRELSTQYSISIGWMGIERMPHLPPEGHVLSSAERERVQHLLEHVAHVESQPLEPLECPRLFSNTRLAHLCLLAVEDFFDGTGNTSPNSQSSRAVPGCGFGATHADLRGRRGQAGQLLALAAAISSAYWRRGCDIGQPDVLANCIRSAVELDDPMGNSAENALACLDPSRTVSDPRENRCKEGPPRPSEGTGVPPLLERALDDLVGGELLERHRRHQEIARASKVEILPTLIVADCTIVGPQPAEIITSVFEKWRGR